MPDIHFFLDEDVSHKILLRLRKDGFSVKSVHTENMHGIQNGELLQYCIDNKYVLITHDQDFLTPAILNFEGIIVVRIHPTIDSIAGPILSRFLEDDFAEEMLNGIVLLELDKFTKIE